MLEPFLMITVLNCLFMFSSTVTTCALWWQYRRHGHSCSSQADVKKSEEKSKKCKSYEDTSMKDERKNCIRNIVGPDGSKESLKKGGKSTRAAKESKKEKKIKSFGKNRSKEAKENVEYSEKLTSTEDIRERAPPSPSSEGKSTVVMEVSTTQKVVQIFENDRDHRHQLARGPKDTVTYKFSPKNEKKIEFVVQSKSDDGSRAKETTDSV